MFLSRSLLLFSITLMTLGFAKPALAQANLSAQSLTSNQAQLAEIYLKARERNVLQATWAQKVAWYSQIFLNRQTPYLGDPLGEGAGAAIDSDPLYRFDAFDCTTFVETILSLSKASTPKGFERAINFARYQDGKVAYERRNHFTILDWVPNGERYHFFKDATLSLAPDVAQLSETLIDKKAWAEKLGKKPEAFSSEVPRISKLYFIPKTELLDQKGVMRKIPSGSVINIVRPQWDLRNAIGTLLDISHQGFAIRENGILYFRHASVGKTVVQEELSSYMQRMMSVATIGGIQVLAPFEK